jgi:Tfp pilus assembly PilM family ATPase
LKSGRFITVDIGSESVGLAEFSRHASGQLELLDWAFAAYELSPSSEMTQDAVVATTLNRLLAERKCPSRRAVVALEGQAVFSRLVQLPPVSPDKLEQTIRHEAVQNIPFPIDEVVWDGQVVEPGAEPEVLLVAVKADLANGMAHAVSATGVSPEIIDIAPAALANAVRFTYSDLECPLLIVDMGTQSSNLIFIDGPRTFFRTLPVASNTTQRMAQEISRSVSFYCNQQGGNSPQQVILCGQLDGLHDLMHDFSEWLRLPVEVFDPLQKIRQGGHQQRVDSPHRFGVLVGLAVRQAGTCAIEINLMPEALRQERAFRRRQPLLVACIASAAILAGIWAAGFTAMASLAREEAARVGVRIAELEAVEARLVPVERRTAEQEYRHEVYHGVAARKTVWVESLLALRRLMPEGMFLSALEPIRNGDKLAGMRVTVISYLDKEPAGQDAVIEFRDRVRACEEFGMQSEVVKRPTKKLFARDFEVNIFFEESVKR